MKVRLSALQQLSRYIQIHTHRHTHRHRHTITHAHTHTHTQTHTHTHAYTHTTHIHTHIHTHVHEHTRTHINACIHTHRCLQSTAARAASSTMLFCRQCAQTKETRLDLWLTSSALTLPYHAHDTGSLLLVKLFVSVSLSAMFIPMYTACMYYTNMCAPSLLPTHPFSHTCQIFSSPHTTPQGIHQPCVLMAIGMRLQRTA